MKVAKYKYIGTHSYETVSDDGLDGVDTYVRISEFVDVEFQPRAEDAVIDQHLSKLDEAEQELRTKFQDALNSIERQRAELRALTHVAS